MVLCFGTTPIGFIQPEARVDLDVCECFDEPRAHLVRICHLDMSQMSVAVEAGSAPSFSRSLLLKYFLLLSVPRFAGFSLIIT